MTAGYEHTQRGKLHYIVLAVAAIELTAAVWVAPVHRPTAVVLTLAAVVIAVVALTVRDLTVRDAGAFLVVSFGPLPLFARWIAYDDILAADVGTTSLLDGWGVHWLPGRGWTYNVWGFACVELTLRGERTVRIGTDDAAGLADFVRRRMVNPPVARSGKSVPRR